MYFLFLGLSRVSKLLKDFFREFLIVPRCLRILLFGLKFGLGLFLGKFYDQGILGI